MKDSFPGFLERLGWHLDDRGVPDRQDGGHLVVRVGGREPLTIHELGIGQAWPPYHERLKARAVPMAPGGQPPPAVQATGPTQYPDMGIVAFTDPAHSRYLWTWAQVDPAGCPRYIEFLFPDAAEALEEGLLARWSAAGPPRGETAPPPREAPALLNTLLGRIPIPPPGPEAETGEVCRWCHAADDPAAIRLLWRELERTRVIDLECGAGEWLLVMAEILRALHFACLDRMRSLLQDHSLHSNAGRKPGLEGFRAVLEAMDDRRRYISAEAFVRGKIVERSLFGWCVEPGEVVACRRGLASWSGVRGPIETNIRSRGNDGTPRAGPRADSGATSALVSRNRDFATFDRGHIPAACVAPPWNSAAIPRRRALPAGRVHALGADANLCYGTLDLSEEEEILRFARDVAVRDPDSFHSASDRRHFRRTFERRRTTLVRRVKALAAPTDPCQCDQERLVQLLGIGLWSREDIRVVRALEPTPATSAR